MLSLPDAMVRLLSPFASLFDAQLAQGPTTADRGRAGTADRARLRPLPLGAESDPLVRSGSQPATAPAAAPTGPGRSPPIARTTPVLLGLFSWVTVVAHALLRSRPLVPRWAAWYPKTRPTFADALALVRLTLWTGRPPFARSRPPPDRQKPSPLDPAQLWEFLCYTA